MSKRKADAEADAEADTEADSESSAKRQEIDEPLSAKPAPPALMPLEIKNPHPNDGRIIFVDEGHEYWIDGDKRGIKSVTKLAHFGFREFDADAIIANMQKDPAKWALNKYYPKSAEVIKAEWAANADAAATRGTWVHRQIELYYNGLEHDADSVEFGFFLNFVREHPDLEIYRTEWNLFAPDLRIAGQADAVFKNERGEFVIFDWKTCLAIKKTGFCRCPGVWRGEPHQVNADGSPCEAFGCHPLTYGIPNANFWQYATQLNVYRWLLKHYYGIEANELCLIVVNKNNDDYIRYDLPIAEDFIDDLMAERRNELRAAKERHDALASVLPQPALEIVENHLELE